MSWLRTLLAVWLTLAVPLAGVAAASVAPDCASHGPAQGHAGHAAHPDDDAAECECGVLHCGSGLSLADADPMLPHRFPGRHAVEAHAVAGFPTPLPHTPFRPPISI